MPFRCLLATLAAAWLSVPWTVSLAAESSSTSSPLEVKIDPSKNHGVWEGWGTSLCWMGNVFGDRNDVADLLFTAKSVSLLGENLPGLGFNIVRYNLGACSPSTIDGRRMRVSKIILPYRQMEGFWLDGKNPDPQSASWNWNADAKQRAMLLEAKERGADRFELFSNSPMWWMCANDNPSGAANGRDDNLPEKNYPAFATYLATVAKMAKEKWGVAFTTVEPFNEPSSGYWFSNGKQEGCQFNFPAQIAFLPLLRAELDRQGMKDLPISASDETAYDQAIGAWSAYPPSVKDLVAQVNVHGYQLAGGDRAGLHRLVSEGGKRLWNSEYGEKDGTGLELARNLHRDLAALHPTAWCYWQPLDGGGWGVIDTDMVKGVFRKVNPKLFVLAQYTRHIRPGMTILDSGDANTVAAYDAKARRLVLVTLNDGPARTVTYDLSAFAVPDQPVASALTEPQGAARYRISRNRSVKQTRLAAEFPAHSIQTFEIENVTPR